MVTAIKSRLVIVTLALSFAALALGFYAFVATTSSRSRAEAVQASTPSGNSTGEGGVVSALGRIEPQSELIEVGASPGDRLGRLVVKEGQHVKAGEALAYLDSYSERLAEKNYYERQLQEARERLDAETRHGKAVIQEAETQIRQIEELQPLDIEAQEAQVAMYTAELASSRADLDRIKVMRQKLVASQQAVDHQVLLVEQTQAKLNNASATLERLKTGRDVNLTLAREQLATAKANLTRSQSMVQVESLTASVNLSAARLDRTIISAPIDGQILKIIAHPGESLGKGPILKMGNTQEMYAVAEVYETAIRRVELGQKATISSPALAGTVTGTVIQIGRTIYKNDVLNIDPTADTDARVVEVKIRLDQSERVAALTNLQVDVQINVGK